MLRELRGAAAQISALAIVLGALAASPATAQEAEVVATVNGEAITQRDVAIAVETLGPQLQRVPEQLRPAIIIDMLIDQKVLADAARSEGVEDNEIYKQRLAYFTDQALRDAYVETVLADSITDEEVKTRYDAEVAKLPAQEEARARHILVETEEAAKEVAEAAKGGADFAELAKEKSTGPSGPNGGDLGYFTADRMVPEFSAAAFALEVGGISDPIKTQFGWHVIKLEDKRQKPPPPLDEVSTQIKALVLRDRIQERSKALREAATIEYAGQSAQ